MTLWCFSKLFVKIFQNASFCFAQKEKDTGLEQYEGEKNYNNFHLWVN